MRALTALAVAGLLPLAVPAEAVKPSGVVRILATGNAQMQVTLRQPTTLWLQTSGGVAGPTISAGASEHAGFVLVPATSSTPTIGVVNVPAGSHSRYDVVVGGKNTPTLPAGRYTLRVVSDQSIDVRVKVSGTPSTTWTARAPLTVRDKEAGFDPAIGPEVVGRAGVRITASSVVVTLATFRVAGHGIAVAWCASSKPWCVDDAERQDGTAEPLMPFLDDEVGAAFVLPPRTFAAGEAFVTWTARTKGLLRDPRAFALVIG